MRLTVLGGCAAWPDAGQACGGFLVEHDGMRLLIDPGYATLPRLLERYPADQIDAVFVSHGHPDHCADLQPLLRARALLDRPGPSLPVYAPTGSLARLLAIDEPGLIDEAYRLYEFQPGERLHVGPFDVRTWLLPHWVPNAGALFRAGGKALAYTGDTGPSSDLIELARDADLLLAEATYVDTVPERYLGNLSSAADVGRYAARANAGRVLLTHLWPGTEPAVAVDTAIRAGYAGPVDAASAGPVAEL